MAICTNGLATYVDRVVEAHDLHGFFEIVRGRTSVEDTKPTMVRELLDTLAGRPAIVIGDRIDDIEAAHSNGLRAIAAGYGYGNSDALIAVDAVARSLRDVPGLVHSFASHRI
jgi:phosphoglycolate phosphatase